MTSTNKKIRQTKNPEEINSILKHACEEKREFLIWQRDEWDAVLFQIKAQLAVCNASGTYEFILNEIPHLDPKRVVYFAINDSSLVFKSNELQFTGSSLIINMPNEATYKDRRLHRRTSFKYSGPKHVEVHYHLKNPNPEAIDDGPTKIMTKVLDASDGGLCLLISKEVYDQIDLAIPLFLKSLNKELTLTYPHAEIKNTRPYTALGLGHGAALAVGIMFVINIEEDEGL